MKYQWFTPSGCKEIGISKCEFVTKTQQVYFIIKLFDHEYIFVYILYIFVYILAKAAQTAGPNGLKLFEGTPGVQNYNFVFQKFKFVYPTGNAEHFT